MLTLRDASVDARKFLKYAVIFLFFIFIGIVLLNAIIFVKNIFFPPGPPKVTALFGRLPEQTFPSGIPNGNYEYNINTITGAFPNFPSVINVYKIQQNIPDLLAADKLNSKFRNAGFGGGYKAVTDKIFEWKNDTNYGAISKALRANIITGDFTITSDYLNDKAILSGASITDQSEAIGEVKSLFSSMKISTEDLDLDNIKTSLYSISGGTLIPATSLSQSKVVEVNVYQKMIDDIPIYYEKPNKSNINVFVAGGGRPQIVNANYVHQSISKDFATYPIKTTQKAFDDLKSGKGYIASYDGKSNSISINNVVLAYYIAGQPQDFLMPIYVFSGNENFYAYVPAITDELINK